jgi:LacI family transcriptional regulator
VAELRDRGAQALALVADGDPPDIALRALGAAGLPFVLVSAVDLHHPAPAVVFDGFSAGFQATQHLIQAGCRNLVMLLPFDADWVRERVEGARRAIAECGQGRVRLDLYPRKAPAFAKVAARGPLIYHDPGRAAGEILLPKRRPRVQVGYIAINDAMAFGFLEVAAERDLRAGKDFLLIGFDDLPDARHAGLSSFRVPLEQMGREAGRLLLQGIRGDRNVSQVKVLATLLPRASSAGKRTGI